MDNILEQIFNLIKNRLHSAHNDSYKLFFIPTSDEKKLLQYLEEKDCIQEIIEDDKIIAANDITCVKDILVEVIHFGLRRFEYYDSFQDFLSKNEFVAPTHFYIRDLDYVHSSSLPNPRISSYFAIIKLINCLTSLSLFESNEDVKVLYIMQEKSALALPVLYSLDLIEQSTIDVTKIESFVAEIATSVDRKKIYIKELIDYLNEEVQQARFARLIQKFDDFYSKCETAYAFFLSDFSYSKLKLELESAILDYSKNIRSIINDSQSKLVAIPAAFIIASSQLNLEEAFSVKNVLIIVSSLIFSLLIEIFIKNQESSLNIFVDNVISYKTTFSLKNVNTAEKESKSLQSFIAASFKAIDKELASQRDRLKYIRIINWGVSIFLIVVLFFLYYNPPMVSGATKVFNFIKSWAMGIDFKR